MLNRLAKWFGPVWPIWMGVSVVVLLASLALPIDWLDYNRQLIGEGEFWRLYSGHFTHTNHWHLLMNLAGLLVLAALHGMHYRNASLLSLLLCGPLLISAGLWFYYPDTQLYVGLSGLLHGLFAFGVIADIKRGWRSGYLLALGLVVKLGYELSAGASTQLESLIQARVATESHWLGALAGTLIALVWLVLDRKPS
ncbi:rhombosortase [Paraferrimonas sedimenticola]|uniref:Rhombosortase n=1 Tax=Paraferrimonas sedimenticola TaxID=375674 RepID=A0AA37RYS7_9GAMM|nr:rhombosortase [Paraferrimonas sedimenticola]GLP97880.1 rhombosortase [Paraferrimonas sedimenticola]